MPRFAEGSAYGLICQGFTVVKGFTAQSAKGKGARGKVQRTPDGNVHVPLPPPPPVKSHR